MYTYEIKLLYIFFTFLALVFAKLNNKLKFISLLHEQWKDVKGCNFKLQMTKILQYLQTTTQNLIN